MKKNIFLKIIVLILLFSVITSLFLITYLRNSYTDEKVEELKNYANYFKVVLKDKDYENIEKYLSQYDSIKNSIRITIILDTGEVLFDNKENYNNMENHRNRSEVITAINEGNGIESRFSSTLKKEMLYYAELYSLDSGEDIIIRTAIPISSIYYFIRNIFNSFIFIIIIGIVIAVFFGLSIINKLEENFKKINDAISRIENGYYGEKLINEDKDFVQLVNNFNKMSRNLSQKIESLEFENTSLNSIFKSMEDGVVVLDNKKRTIYNNEAVNKIFEYDGKIEGKKISDIIRNYELNTFLELFYKNPKYDNIEIQYNDRILKITSNELKGYSNRFRTGAVLMIQDITEIRKLEKIRSDFVSNVTHELKTPLTSIKGFIETLKDSDKLDKKTKLKFYEIIELETERLSNLINDMLTLSEIETTTGEHKSFKVEEVIEEVVELLNNIAEEKNIRLEVESFDNNVYLKGDKNRFKQMLINLIENGIKYNNPGGFVFIKYKKEKDILILNVIDDGIGIEEGEIERLFERFYRVDKSRDRGRGGTGLGLAIVKHIVKSLNGKIFINSKINEGTTFLIKIPIV